MKKNINPLLNKDFLKKLDNEKNREVFVRITSLDINEKPVERIEGKVSSGGSINVNGSSAVRRTCSLTLMASLNTKITETYWALKTKFKLEVGLRNHIDPDYEDIIWFNQGIYVITSFSLSRSSNAFNISISGQDKMVLLNGALGGILYAETVFDTIDEQQQNGDWITRKIPIYEIIRTAIHNYGNEPFENIIINDIPEIGYELWEYKGIEPLYILIKINNFDEAYDEGKLIKTPSLTYYNISTNQNSEIYVYDKNGMWATNPIYLSEMNELDYYNYNSIFSGIAELARPVRFNQNGNKYFIAKIDTGELAGYHRTPLIYPGPSGSLTLSAGSAISALLDKIKSMLGAYEYFYDIDGRFVFQKQPNYTQGIATIKTDQEKYVPSITITPYSYQFIESELITNISKSPAIDKIKNDYVCWGNMKSASGVDLPIHAITAFMKQPEFYTTFEGKIYFTNSYALSKGLDIKNSYDYRELIYQMAMDYNKYGQEENFISQLIINNSYKYPTGKTGYEPYYQELLGFWRQLYNPEIENEDYYNADENETYKYWNKSAIQNPGSLYFWFEIIDTGGELSELNIEKIGRRSLVKNEKTVITIGMKDTPEVVFVLPEEVNMKDTMEALVPIQIQKTHLDLFNTVSSGVSAIEQLDTMISENIMGTEGLNLTTIPIYYLEPNTRIYVKNKEEKIDGDYIISQLSIPLTYNGTMSITTTKVMKEI